MTMLIINSLLNLQKFFIHNIENYMKFIPWCPPRQTRVVRVYVTGFKGVGIGLAGGTLSITKATQEVSLKIQSFLSGQGIKLNSFNSISQFVAELELKGLVQGSRTEPEINSKVVSINSKSMRHIIDSVVDDNKGANNRFTPSYRTRSLAELSQATTQFDIKKIPMLSKTRKNMLVELDHREPEGIADILRGAGVHVDIVTLKDGDVRVTMIGDDSKEMIWERKVISDLSASIQSQNCHAHDQAERMSLYREHRQSEGCSVGIFWLYEYQNSGQTSLYNCLELSQSTDGWLCYVQAICGHQVVHSFNEYHSATLILKFCQGFFEEELRNKVTIKSSGVRVDRTKSERVHIHAQMTGDTGVTRPAQGVGGMLATFPGVSVTAAKSLASTGKSIGQIMQMTIEEMIECDGIAKKTATHLHTLFNLVD